MISVPQQTGKRLTTGCIAVLRGGLKIDWSFIEERKHCHTYEDSLEIGALTPSIEMNGSQFTKGHQMCGNAHGRPSTPTHQPIWRNALHGLMRLENDYGIAIWHKEYAIK